MIDNVPTFGSAGPGRPRRSFEARSVTGACYLLVEDDRDGANRHRERHYRTAYAGLPVVANDDGTFTIVATDTRLVPVGAR